MNLPKTWDLVEILKAVIAAVPRERRQSIAISFPLSIVLSRDGMLHPMNVHAAGN